MSTVTGVLLMAYGSPYDPDEIGPYFTDIRGGRPPSPEALRELTERYRRVGKPSLLNEVTARQADGLAAHLQKVLPGRFQVFVGMKHWRPFIKEAVQQIAEAGITKVIGIVLAPHFSRKSIGEYEQRFLKANDELQAGIDLVMVQQWYGEPKFVQLVAENLSRALAGWDTSDGATRVFFTAHSIPSRIISEGDPYAGQLAASAELYAEAAGISDFCIGWQSASATGEPWIGPDILDLLEEFAREGGQRALIAPVGFVSDHLEILYDIDIECAEKAGRLGTELRRISSPNDDPRFIEVLGDLVIKNGGESKDSNVTMAGVSKAPTSDEIS